MSNYWKAPDDGLEEAIEAMKQEAAGEKYCGYTVTVLAKWLQELLDYRKRSEMMQEFFFGDKDDRR